MIGIFQITQLNCASKVCGRCRRIRATLRRREWLKRQVPALQLGETAASMQTPEKMVASQAEEGPLLLLR